MDWPPSPAHMLNQKSPARGIPYDSNFLKSALEGEVQALPFPGAGATSYFDKLSMRVIRGAAV